MNVALEAFFLAVDARAIAAAANRDPKNDSAALCIRDCDALIARAKCVGDYANAIERALRGAEHVCGRFGFARTQIAAKRDALQALVKGAA